MGLGQRLRCRKRHRSRNHEYAGNLQALGPRAQCVKTHPLAPLCKLFEPVPAVFLIYSCQVQIVRTTRNCALPLIIRA